MALLLAWHVFTIAEGHFADVGLGLSSVVAAVLIVGMVVVRSRRPGLEMALVVLLPIFASVGAYAVFALWRGTGGPVPAWSPYPAVGWFYVAGDLWLITAGILLYWELDSALFSHETSPFRALARGVRRLSVWLAK
jgi:hypothetical protein